MADDGRGWGERPKATQGQTAGPRHDRDTTATRPRHGRDTAATEAGNGGETGATEERLPSSGFSNSAEDESERIQAEQRLVLSQNAMFHCPQLGLGLQTRLLLEP
jgi:hypothetical protein